MDVLMIMLQFFSEVSCPNPEVPNGNKESGFGSLYTYKDTVTFVCKAGYVLTGSHLIRCGADNAWSPPVPTCVRRKCERLIS